VGNDSFERGLLDHPHYTRPADVNGDSVPDVLLSGNHAEIRRWRKHEAVKRTLERRPDLLTRDGLALDEEEREILRRLRDSELDRKARAGA
jgi:tRNA (guanine37-N1)-methyltransferase